MPKPVKILLIVLLVLVLVAVTVFVALWIGMKVAGYESISSMLATMFDQLGIMKDRVVT